MKARMVVHNTRLLEGFVRAFIILMILTVQTALVNAGDGVSHTYLPHSSETITEKNIVSGNPFEALNKSSKIIPVNEAHGNGSGRQKNKKVLFRINPKKSDSMNTENYQSVNVSGHETSGVSPDDENSFPNEISMDAPPRTVTPFVFSEASVPIVSGLKSSEPDRESGIFLNGSFFKDDPANDPMKLNKASVLDLKSLKSSDNSIYPFFDKTDESVLLEFSIGAGYAYSQDGFSFSPYVKANYSKAEIDANAQNDPTKAFVEYRHALQDDEQYAESFSGVLGSQLRYSLNTDLGIVTPYFRLEWEHEFDDNARLLSARFFKASKNSQDDESITNSSLTGEIDRDFFNVGLGISTVFPHGIIAFIDYETILGFEDLTNHQVSAGLQFEF